LRTTSARVHSHGRMTTPIAKPGAPKAPPEEDSGVHKGFYEHSTGGKVPRAPFPAPASPKSAAAPPPKQSLVARAAGALSRAVRSVFGRR
jgi:hypothetical protein